MSQLKSQILGLLLGLFTAIGCILYEKIVHNFSLSTVMFIKIIETVVMFTLVCVFVPTNFIQDFSKMSHEPKYILWSFLFVLTGVTSILWYTITRNQGVMTSSIYEVKYIVIMAVLYIFFGDNRFTLNTAIGVGLAMGSIYFISKT